MGHYRIIFFVYISINSQKSQKKNVIYYSLDNRISIAMIYKKTGYIFVYKALISLIFVDNFEQVAKR